MQIENRPRRLIVVFLTITLLVSWTPLLIAAAAPPAKEAVPPAAAEAKSAWKEKWDKTLAAAKTEGTIMIYTSAEPIIRKELTKDFQGRFGIRTEFVVGSPAEVTRKMLAEKKAGLHLADVFQSGHTTMSGMLGPEGFLEPLPPVILLPEVIDGKMWLTGTVPYYNKNKTIIGFLGNNFSHIVVNTDMVKKGQITSYMDVLRPEWKGKIVMDMPVVNGPGRNWLKIVGGMFNFNTDKLKTYLQQLSAQDPMIIRDRRLQVEWVSKGKYAVLLGVSTGMYSGFKKAGAPIAMLRMKEGSLLTEGPGAVCLIRQAPHPNAAIVFINWLLSKEGQSVYAKALGSPSLRLDVPTEGIDPMFVSIPGEKVFVDNEEMDQVTMKLVEIAKQALAPHLK